MSEQEIIKLSENIHNYKRIVSRIVQYIKTKNLSLIFNKKKSKLFAIGGEDKKISIFTSSLEFQGYLHGHYKSISCLESFSQVELISGSADNSIKLWNLKGTVNCLTLSPLHKGPITALAICQQPEGRILMSGSRDNNIIMWDLDIQRQPKILSNHHKSWIVGIITLNKGKSAISGDYFGELRVWNVEKGICMKAFRVNYYLTSMGYYDGSVGCNYLYGFLLCYGIDCISRNVIELTNIGYSFQLIKEKIVVRGTYSGELETIDIKSGKYLKPSIQIHSACITNIRKITQNIVLTVSADKQLKVLDISTRKCYYSFDSEKSMEKLATFI